MAEQYGVSPKEKKVAAARADVYASVASEGGYEGCLAALEELSPQKPQSPPEPETSPSPRTSPPPEPPPPVEGSVVAGRFRAMLNAYNAGLYHAAAINHTPALIQACGGVDGLAVALEQNHLIEELDYELHSLKITGTNPDGTVDADITISSVDPATGQLWDDHLALGWSFKQANGQWLVAADYFPFGVGAFC